MEKAALRVHLKGCEEVGLAVTQHSREVREELCQWFVLSARWRRRLDKESRSERALRGTQAPPEPIAARQREAAAGLGEPSCPACQPAEHRPREAEQGQRAHDETEHHGHEGDRKGPAATGAQMAVRAEQAPPAHYPPRAALGVAAQKPVADQRPSLLAIRARRELDAEQHIGQRSLVSYEAWRAER